MNSKVGRLIEGCELPGMDGRLIDFWTSNGGERRSLRDLANYFNSELLRATMADVGMTTLDGEVANTYRLLTIKDVSTGVRRLKPPSNATGSIPSDSGRISSPISRSTPTSLSSVASRTQLSESDRTASRRQTTRSSAWVVASSPSPKSGWTPCGNTGAITLGTFSVLVDVRVVCEDCGTHADVRTLLIDGGYDCAIEG